MKNSPPAEDDFLSAITSTIELNASNEQFGVSELADEIGMSRSNLLRKIKKETSLSASQYIRKIRLEIGMELIKESTLSISEVSYKVGFGSTSYFIKCFREQYGYPPGEVGKQKSGADQQITNTTSKKSYTAIIVMGVILTIVTSWFFWGMSTSENTTKEDSNKSIAVLPFKNDSNDSSNVYFVNGLMESTLNNLQKIQNLRVISRTSVEKYRESNMTISEIARELNVRYFVEGSGQKLGDKVLLNIQLIDASTDRHLWAEQYNREVIDIFDLQNEVASKITQSIRAIVTPAEQERIEKRPTDNLIAYDYYLKALEPYNLRTKEGLEEAILLFNQAVNSDPDFALAYAKLAISYYFLDIYQTEKKYTEKINNYADKALLYDSKSAESLIAKAMYYMHSGEYRLALPHLEKALEYNPNSSAVVQMLADYYATYSPNTSRYLEYALKGNQLNVVVTDSVTKSYHYLHLSNALMQTGFTDEALGYINKSLEYFPGNPYSSYVKSFIQYGKHKSLDRTREELLTLLRKDTSRLDILQEVAKLYFYQEKYDTAYMLYKKFTEAKATYGLAIYPQEDLKIAKVYEETGHQQEADSFYLAYNNFMQNDESLYKSLSIAVYKANKGNLDEAMVALKEFSQQKDFHFWVVLFLEEDPLVNPLMQHPEFEKVMAKIKSNFWKNHEEVKERLMEQGLI